MRIPPGITIEVWVKKTELEKVCGCAINEIKDKHQEIVKDREAWNAEVHGVAVRHDLVTE